MSAQNIFFNVFYLIFNKYQIYLSDLFHFQGFKFDPTNTFCVDLDECKNKNLQNDDMGKCKHLCTNSIGGYEERVQNFWKDFDVTDEKDS